MGSVVDERDGLLTRLAQFQRIHASLHAEEQRVLARLAELPVPSFLESPDKQYVVDELAAVLARGQVTLEHARALSDEALGVDDAPSRRWTLARPSRSRTRGRNAGCPRATAATGWVSCGRCCRPRTWPR
jgi:hypothetical protein